MTREEKIYDVASQIIYVVINNLFFIVVNLPLFSYLYLMIYQGVTLYLILMGLFMILFAISLIALFESLYQFIIKKQESNLRFFWRSIAKACSWDSLPVYLLISLIASIGFLFFMVELSPIFSIFVIIYAILAVYGMLILPFAIMETILFQNTFLKTLLNAMILSFQKWQLQLFTIAYLLFVLLLFPRSPAIFFFVGFSGYCYLFLTFYAPFLQTRIASIKGLDPRND
ncbi:hypothetical protein SFB97_01790 [Enterococcus hirae]|uniref:hypothetical protein n=1 Tax=Enterococcus TaxID=1350 RepID=UPI001A0BEF59|nr:hypothetical protein [Enterococcus hirae]EMF0393385.1 hypothetical protein [Enterococcus hirae]